MLSDWLKKLVHTFASSSDWFTMLFTSVVIGKSDYIGFAFTTPFENRSNVHDVIPSKTKAPV